MNIFKYFTIKKLALLALPVAVFCALAYGYRSLWKNTNMLVGQIIHSESSKAANKVLLNFMFTLRERKNEALHISSFCNIEDSQKAKENFFIEAKKILFNEYRFESFEIIKKDFKARIYLSPEDGFGINGREAKTTEEAGDFSGKIANVKKPSAFIEKVENRKIGIVCPVIEIQNGEAVVSGKITGYLGLDYIKSKCADKEACKDYIYKVFMNGELLYESEETTREKLFYDKFVETNGVALDATVRAIAYPKKTIKFADLAIENDSEFMFNVALAAVAALLFLAAIVFLIDLRMSNVKLYYSEQNLKRIVDNADEGIWQINANSITVFANKKMASILGCEKAGLIGKSLFEFMDGEWKKIAEENIEKRQRGSTERHEFKFMRADGKSIWAMVSASPLYDQQKKYLGALALITDITEKKRADAALIESEERYRNIFMSSADGLIIVDEYGRIVSANPAAEKIYGYASGEMTSLQIEKIISDEYHYLFEQFKDEITKNGIFQCESKDVRKDGAEIFTEVKGVRFISEEKRMFLAIVRDITDKKRAEAEKLKIERQIQHTQKLESLGVLAGGIAHDFNNLLMGILGNASLSLQDLSPSSPARYSIEQIEIAAVRAADLCKQMLAYSGKGKFVIEFLNISSIVEEMTHLMEVSVSKKAILKLNLEKNIPLIEADATQIRQIVMNLITNASEAIGDKSGIIGIRTGAMECDLDYIRSVYVAEEVDEGLYAFIEVSDTGCGMDKETLEKIFDPFFTTKFTGRGLGLAAVLGIVRSHKGAIKVYTEPGKGTTFKVLFPAKHFENGREKSEAEFAAPKWVAEGVALVVDDDETVRAVSKKILELAGFSVIAAADGKEAVEIFKERKDEITFCLLDLTMPHMSGEDAFRELRKVKPGLKIILSSGYNEQDVVNRFVGKNLTGFIQKPYRASDLIEKIRSVF